MVKFCTSCLHCVKTPQKKDFWDCIGLIQTKKIREFVSAALSLAPPQFWLVPASSTGKHHPPEDNVKGGLVVHTRKAMQVALSLFAPFGITGILAKDKILAAVILHDIQKNGIPWGEYTVPEHGTIAAHWLGDIEISGPDETKKRVAREDKDLVEIQFLVRYHMGRWSAPVPAPPIKIGQTVTELGTWLLIVQMADYWASRKWCSFVADELMQKC